MMLVIKLSDCDVAENSNPLFDVAVENVIPLFSDSAICGLKDARCPR